MSRLVQIIRDEIALGARTPFMAGVAPGGTLQLIAREVRLTENHDLGGRNLEIFASVFTASNGAAFIGQGVAGAAGSNGVAGANGRRFPEKEDGSDGGPGGSGGDGTDGTAVTVVSEVVEGLNVDVQGGKGGAGGAGGAGGVGAPRVYELGEPIVDLTNGGNGRPGGNGGAGGNGGTVTVTGVRYITGPIVNVSGGGSGEQGVGGDTGLAGYIEWREPEFPLENPMWEEFGGDPGREGAPGLPGAKGAAGVGVITEPSYDEFWSSLASQPFAAEWAAYRHTMGEFFFRSYTPGVADREGYIGRAVDEFKAAIRLERDPQQQAKSILRLEQIWNNLNPLGLPRDFDLIPDFSTYMDRLTNFGNLLNTFTSIGNTFSLTSTQVDAFQALFKGQVMEADSRIGEAKAQLEISVVREQQLVEALVEVERMMADVGRRIEKAKEEMKAKPLSFGSVVGNVGQLAVAVGALMAAAPTGGASLLALAPNVINLGQTVYQNAEPLAKAIFDDGEEETLTKVKGEFAKVKGNVEDIMTTSDKITDLLNVINNIKRAKKPDNSKLMDLVQKGAELTYEHLLKTQEMKTAKMQTRALGEAVVSEEALQAYYAAEAVRTDIQQQILRSAGLALIRGAFARVDILLEFAFCAQRSVEIYCLQDQRQHVYYDIGRVHPDLEADYAWGGDMTREQLAAKYQASFSRLLNPFDMWETYQKYFKNTSSNPNLILKDIRRLTFNDAEILDIFRSTHQLSFEFDVRDDKVLSPPSKMRYRTKIQAIGIAFVGATSASSIVSCRLEHGALYSERSIVDREVHVTPLRTRYEIITAQTTPLKIGDFDLDSAPPLERPQSSPLWGMGIDGQYTLTVPSGEMEEHRIKFDELMEVQVWLGYQFVE